MRIIRSEERVAIKRLSRMMIRRRRNLEGETLCSLFGAGGNWEWGVI
jgi:hypothetical protein